jgi:hypothetical protein
MLKNLLKQNINNPKVDEDDTSKIAESYESGNEYDEDIEQILPFITQNEGRYDDFRFLLKQLKKRSPEAFKKLSNFD